MTSTTPNWTTRPDWATAEDGDDSVWTWEADPAYLYPDSGDSLDIRIERTDEPDQVGPTRIVMYADEVYLTAPEARQLIGLLQGFVRQLSAITGE